MENLLEKREIHWKWHASIRLKNLAIAILRLFIQKQKKYIGVETGESIIYIYQEEKLDIDSIVDSVMDQYNQPLKDLVDLWF